MKEYLFVLGREPDLSFLELISYLKSHCVKYDIIKYEKNIAIIILPENLDFGKLLTNLGGTVKIGECFEEYFYKGNLNRLNFCVSVYKGKDNLTKILKEEYKKENVKAMQRKPRDKVFMPSEILSKNLFEFLIYDNYKARTIAFFDPRQYKARDETRPRQMLLHQVSLRLAKILINLGQARNTLLDPFCGVGTILQEGMVNGLNVIGIDIDKESCYASRENLNWLKNKFNLKSKFKIINGDARKLTRYLKRNFVEAIASEPDLGPYFKKMPHKEEVNKAVVKLNKLYYEFLSQANAVLKKNGKIALIFPRLKFRGGEKGLAIKSLLKQTGFKVYCADKRVKLPIVTEGRFLDRLIYVLEKA